jgi:hypothetical protein
VPPCDKAVSLHHLSRVQSIEEAAGFLFPVNTLVDLTRTPLYSFLNPFNIRVDEFNQLIIDQISRAKSTYSIFPTLGSYLLMNYLTVSLLATYLSYNSVKEVEDPTDQVPSAVEPDYLAILNKQGVPPHKLQLKSRTIYSITRDRSLEKGLVKNVRVRILGLRHHIIRVELLRSVLSGILLPRCQGSQYSLLIACETPEALQALSRCRQAYMDR